MEISVENTGTLGRRLTVAVPADRFEQAFTERLERLSKQVKVSGFRPGKTPMKVIEARYGERVLQEVAGELIERSFREAIGQQGLKPVAGPVIEHQALERGKDLAYTAEFEVYPEIPKLDLSELKIERPTSSVAPEDVDRSVGSLQHQRVTWQSVEREARDEDRLLVDFKGAVEGQPFEGGDAKDYQLVLGAGGLMDGFEAGLMGAKAGETRTLELKFPEQHPKPELTGKPVTFEVKIREVAEALLPEVNEEFVRQLGLKDGKVETLRERVRANLEREMTQRLRTLIRARVLEALVGANDFELPQTLLKSEIDYVRRLHQAMQPASEGGHNETPEESAAYEQAARNRLARSLILAEVIRANGIKVTPEQVRTRVTAMAQQYESPEEFVRACYANPSRLAEIEASLVEEQAVEHLLNTAEVKEDPITFQELVKSARASG
ncbi:MAG: trigger factor [Acidiferrobacterales bacterium]